MNPCRYFIRVLVCAMSLTTPSLAQELWGVTSAGVADNKGVIFKSSATGSGYSVEHSFITDSPGASPYGSLVLAGGVLYGTSYSGGANDQGVVFSFDPATNTYTKLADFAAASTGAFPQAGMVLAANGKLYGTATGGGANSAGSIFEFDPNTSSLNAVFSFSTGMSPAGGLVKASNNKLYGMTPSGGNNSAGMIYEFTTAGAFSIRYHFDGTTGRAPYGELVEYGTKLYGLTSGGGANEKGVVFEFDPASATYTMKKDISPAGENPYSSLVVSGTKMYGMTLFGGANGSGALFEYDPVGNTITRKKDFDGTSSGSNPTGPLYAASNNLLYGLTTQGGATNDGVVFEFNPSSGVFTKKADLNASSYGNNPQNNGFIEHSNGKLYGLTAYGGPANKGTLIEFNKSTGSLTKRVDFSNASGGSNPQGSLVKGSTGLLYGVTSNGGKKAQGVLFSIDPSTSAYNVVLHFSKLDSGAFPSGTLTEAANGKLYGLTPFGGTLDNGILFEYNPQGDYFYKRVDFNSATTGAEPGGSLTAAPNGKLYGTTPTGGASGAGTLFEFDPNTLTITHTASFSGGLSGIQPGGTLLLASNGKLYGVTNQGGVSSEGTLFEYDPATHVITKKADFASGNGSSPTGELMFGSDGKIYGLASAGGVNGFGVIYQFDIATSTISAKYQFDGTISGSSPLGGLREVAVNKLFGLTSSGGSQGTGTYFSYDLAGGSLTVLQNLGGALGASPQSTTPYLNPAKQTQTITFGSLPSKFFNDPPFTISATASSGLPVTFTSSNPAIASISGNTVTINSFGTVVITASQYGNGSYTYAQDVRQTLVISKAQQTITFTVPTKTFGDAPFDLTGTASSGLAVSYSSSDPTIASITFNTVSILKAGSVDITATQPGNAVYDPAPPVVRTLLINKANQTITFAQPGLPLGQVPFTDGTVSLVASSTSLLPVVFSVDEPLLASISGSTLTILGAGTIHINADQPGNGNYNAASRVSRTLTVLKGNQTITFNALPTKTYGDAPFALTATASSGLAVSYSSSDPTVASISGSTVTILKAGTVTITASQPGNSNYNAASVVNQTLTINMASQTINFPALPTYSLTDPPFNLTATASSGLPVSYTSSNPGVATVSGNTVTIVGTGSTTITASQNGSTGFYLAAPSVQRTLTVTTKQSQTITFGALPAKTVTDAPFTISATATSGLPVTFASSNTAVATVSGNTVTIHGGGTTTITASQAGDATYNPAPDVQQVLTVSFISQTITFGTISDKTIGDASFTLAPTATSGLAVSLTEVSTSKVSIVGNTITLVNPGFATLRASQAGNSTYSAAPTVDQSFCINPAKPTVTMSVTSSEATFTSSSDTGNQWFKDGVFIAGESNKTLVTTEVGSYQVRVSVESCNSALSDAKEFVVTGDISTPIGTVRIYPIPAVDKLFIDLSSYNSLAVDISIVDARGQSVSTRRTTGGRTEEYDVASWAAGLYLVRVQQFDRTELVKWIKQ